MLCLLTLISIGLAPTSHAELKSEPFGMTKDGEAVELYTLTNDHGLVAKIMTRGATVVELHVPDAAGKTADVVFGFDDVAGYESEANQYFGCTAGRVCNRIAKGKFTLDGQEYTLAINNDPNHLHGGEERSFDKVVWKAQAIENERGQGLRLKYTSPDGEEGYPGTVQAQVTYFVPKDRNNLSIRYSATTDKATPINLTNHSYFNLGGHGSPTILDHELRINAMSYTPVDDTLIPTGEIASVQGTPLDFRKPQKIGGRIQSLVETAALGYDHNYVLNDIPEGKKMRVAANLIDSVSGRKMLVMTTLPGVQFYSGNFLSGQQGKDGKTYAHQSGCCLETQNYPDSINHDNFPNTVLRPGEELSSQTILFFSTVKE